MKSSEFPETVLSSEVYCVRESCAIGWVETGPKTTRKDKLRGRENVRGRTSASANESARNRVGQLWIALKPVKKTLAIGTVFSSVT